MTTLPADQTSRPEVREVRNQPPDLRPYNAFTADVALVEGVAREGAAWDHDHLVEIGVLAGSEESWDHSRRAERNLPVLHPYDRFGNRVDVVELDPSWHHLLGTAIAHGMHSVPWTAPEGGHVARVARFGLWSQVNAGVMCPVSMTTAVVPALRRAAPHLAEEWEPALTRTDYETVALSGMAMTERQGGSDVRANVSRAEPLGGDRYAIWGHKWFCSYPPCDIFLVLAHTDAGLSCFLVERGPGLEFQRLKDKLGSRSLPSSEVEFHGIEGRLVGEEGRGVPAIIQMVNQTRMDCIIGAVAGLRSGTTHAVHHTRHRTAFGRRLADQPAMANVLADLAIESEAATHTALRLARAYDAGDVDAGEAAFRRLGTAIEKYWICKRSAAHAAEALECLGGNGYVEDSGMPLVYRDSILNGIWEGSGNVAALDVLRAMAKSPEAVTAFMAECRLAEGADARLDAHLDAVEAQVTALWRTEDPQDVEYGARTLVEDMAVALQASMMVRHAPAASADAFCAGRLGDGGRVYGTLPAGLDTAAIIDRALAV
ncbi:acyl-CoA dehydrogenase family protein [Euzebya sp.]|uniref:acyl-CoA dehydrogenase family protein n=1 Tax=Euzebya sp. TaxID=1971409 RepID=UPI003514238E